MLLNLNNGIDYKRFLYEILPENSVEWSLVSEIDLQKQVSIALSLNALFQASGSAIFLQPLAQRVVGECLLALFHYTSSLNDILRLSTSSLPFNEMLIQELKQIEYDLYLGSAIEQYDVNEASLREKLTKSVFTAIGGYEHRIAFTDCVYDSESVRKREEQKSAIITKIFPFIAHDEMEMLTLQYGDTGAQEILFSFKKTIFYRRPFDDHFDVDYAKLHPVPSNYFFSIKFTIEDFFEFFSQYNQASEDEFYRFYPVWVHLLVYPAVSKIERTGFYIANHLFFWQLKEVGDKAVKKICRRVFAQLISQPLYLLTAKEALFLIQVLFQKKNTSDKTKKERYSLFENIELAESAYDELCSKIPFLIHGLICKNEKLPTSYQVGRFWKEKEKLILLFDILLMIYLRNQ